MSHPWFTTASSLQLGSGVTDRLRTLTAKQKYVCHAVSFSDVSWALSQSTRLLLQVQARCAHGNGYVEDEEPCVATGSAPGYPVCCGVWCRVPCIAQVGRRKHVSVACACVIRPLIQLLASSMSGRVLVCSWVLRVQCVCVVLFECDRVYHDSHCHRSRRDCTIVDRKRI